MTETASDALMLERFRHSERRLRVRLARLGAWLAVVLILAGSGLDYLLSRTNPAYESLWIPFVQIRLLCVALLLGVTALLYSPWAIRLGTVLAVLLGFLPALAICAMIYLADGADSPYYAGLILILVVVTQLLQSFREAFLYSLALITSYCLVCVLNGGGSDATITVYNLVILIMTGSVCVAVCDLNATRRWHEFRLAFDLEMKQHELAELNRVKSQFFANVSHELRTPLTLILAPVEALLHRQPPLPQAAGQQLHLVQRNGLRLLALINDLLDIIRMEQCRLELNRRAMSVGQLVAAVAEAMRDAAQQNGVTLSCQGTSLRTEIFGDEMRLERVFLNLVSNAIKFTGEGGEIRLEVLRRDGLVCVQVRDTGIGIPAKELPHIFERYYQVRDAAATSRQGLGIGLHLTRELVEAHGGTIQATSDVGAGTTFIVSLPALPAQPGGTAEPLTVLGPLSPSAPPLVPSIARGLIAGADAAGELPLPLLGSDGDGARPRVLVIDDEPDMRRFLVSILEEKYTVVSASSAERGIDLAQQCPPDLVLLDLMLPGMDGLEACSCFRASDMPPDLKLIMLTAKIDEGTKITALRRGADDFLTKPFNSIEVLTRVEKLLQTSQLQATLRGKNRDLEAVLLQLQQTEAQLVQSEKMNALGRLAAGLLHEINNPLNYTLVAVQIAQRCMMHEDPELRDNLHDIREGLKRISDIISDLRAFAYPDQAGHHRPFSLRDAISTATRFTAHDLSEVELTLPQGDLPLVSGSPTQISQVLVNLISNGVYAVRQVSSERPPQIAIEADSNHQRLAVRVRDNGAGINPCHLSKIFDPFFTTKPEGQGIGLGLSVCHTIVGQHGGELEVQSEPGRGTMFSFTLPLAEARNESHEQQ